MPDKYLKRVLDALISILTSYAAISLGIGVFEQKIAGAVGFAFSLFCILWIASLYDD